MRGAIPPLPNTPSWRGAVEAHGQLYLYLIQDAITLDVEPPLGRDEDGDGDAVMKKGTIITLRCFICMPLGCDPATVHRENRSIN